MDIGLNGHRMELAASPAQKELKRDQECAKDKRQEENIVTENQKKQKIAMVLKRYVQLMVITVNGHHTLIAVLLAVKELK